MITLSKAQKSRVAIRAFKTMIDGLVIRGFYKPSGTSGESVEKALREISPEIYGAMNETRITELKGLEYVLERLPLGIESSTRIILTAEEELEETQFEKIIPPKRRRISYRVSEQEFCFIISHGVSEIYDILTHLTFLNIEANKIYQRIYDENNNLTYEWRELENYVLNKKQENQIELDQGLWNLSILLGCSFQQTKSTYDYLRENIKLKNGAADLFEIIYHLGKRVANEMLSTDNKLIIYFTPILKDMIGHHQYTARWAKTLHEQLISLQLQDRPLHIMSANMHSVINLLYGHGLMQDNDSDFISLVQKIREQNTELKQYAFKYGLTEIIDQSGAHVDVQIIDTAKLNRTALHPKLNLNWQSILDEKAVIIVLDYAFGEQAFQILDDFLEPAEINKKNFKFDIRSISIMGKAGILSGKKGDIILATAHVLEGTPHNYIVENDLLPEDFGENVNVYVGPVVTVLGTSLQNREILKKFMRSSWKAVGLEMEGGHYQRAISSAIIRKHISREVKVRYVYYASDNPLISGQTLAFGGMGTEGIRPTYLITKVLLEKILNDNQS